MKISHSLFLALETEFSHINQSAQNSPTGSTKKTLNSLEAYHSYLWEEVQEICFVANIINSTFYLQVKSDTHKDKN